MKYFKNSLLNTRDFLLDSIAYFRDVLLMHGLMLFIVLPALSALTRFILRRGGLSYFSYDTIGIILSKHGGVLLALIGVFLLMMLAVFFEFTFLLISVYFVKKKQPIGLRQLLRATLLQIKKIRVSTVLFFLFYFFLILPFGGLGAHSDLLSKIKIPAFIQDFIFANRVTIIALWVVFYLLCLYLGIRLIFALPEMILRDVPFRKAIPESWRATRQNFLKIGGQFLIIGGLVFLSVSVSYVLIIGGQTLVEQFLPDYSLRTAIVAMTFLQITNVFNMVLTSVLFFYVIIDFMDDEGFLPEIPQWFYQAEVSPKRQWTVVKLFLFAGVAGLFGIGLGVYNMEYLTDVTLSEPVVVSHRAVTGVNGVQNTIPALEDTARYRPDFVEMDIQETKDRQFVVIHDTNLKELAGIDRRVPDMTLAELQAVTLSENGLEAKIPAFDEFLTAAKQMDQRLLIEIKTNPEDSSDLVTIFLEKYAETIKSEHHMIHSLTYNVVQQIKAQEPTIPIGYVLPFNIVGPPIMDVDFFTMEYSTLNANFVNSAHKDGKKVMAWTVNDEDSMTRMMYYGVDGIITDHVDLLEKTENDDLNETTYSDKLIHFILGIG